MKETYLINPELPVIKEGWKGNLVIGEKFCNTNHDEKYSFWELMKWQLSRNPQREEKKNDPFRLKVIPNDTFSVSSGDKIVWLGHASFYIKIGGHTFITDPVFESVFMLKRHAGMPCSTEKIKGIDYVLLSHNHRDHVDFRSIKDIVKNNPKVEALLPLKLHEKTDKYLYKYQEAGWYQQYKTNPDLKVFFMPAKHWSRRGMFDGKKTLWGSYIIQSKGLTIFFAGDCAYEETNFVEIAKLFPQIDIALIPIGAYKPAYIMKRAHLSPEDAVNVSKILNAKVFIPMHYGTFDLSDEPMGEPYRILQKMNQDGLIKSKLQFLDIGEEYKL